MSGDGDRDVWSDLVLGQPRPFVDPTTGEVVMEQPIFQPTKRKAADAGYVMVNMEGLVAVGRHLNLPGVLILLEAARQWRMGNGALAITSALRDRVGITRKQCRGALAELTALGDATGWVAIFKSGKKATLVKMTAIGMKQLWRDRF